MEIKDFLIDEECTIIQAMERLDKTGKKILFATKNGRFVAALTDGDIRRWILKKGNLEAKVKDIANYQPKYLLEKDKHLAIELMKKHSIEAVPIIDENNTIVLVVFWNEEKIERKKLLDIPVVIMAGGLGTRLYPYTKILPKPLIPIGEIPIAEHIMNRFVSYGTKEFFLVVNYKKNMIKAYFNELEKSYQVYYVEENKPLGTGGGLSLLRDKVDRTFILTNCDIIIKEDYERIYDFHKKQNNLITMVCSLKRFTLPYGIIEINDTGEIEEIKEKPQMSFFTNTGMYIVEPTVINELEDNLAIDFPDIIKKCKEQGKKIGIYPISENNWLDMGQFDQMEEMRRRLEEEN